MVDLGFHGLRFTWVNTSEVGYFIQKRLGKGFANMDWGNLYPEASIQHLARIHSNHCPILLSLDCLPTYRLTKPFKFQPMWMSHPLFSKLVKYFWEEDSHLNGNVDYLTKEVMAWNKDVFGNIFQRKNRVKARLRVIQISIANGPSEFLINLEA